MDRFDERKSGSEPTPEVISEQRQGDILGLTGSEVPKAPDDPSTEYGSASLEELRDRPRAGDVLGLARESDDLTRGAGATGVDSGRDDADPDIVEEER